MELSKKPLSVFSKDFENKSVLNESSPGKGPSMGLVHIFSITVNLVVIVWIFRCLRPPKKRFS